MTATAADSGTTAPLGFVFHGERPCLDFANTLRRRKDPRTPTIDLLDRPGALAEWIGAGRAKAAWSADLPGLRAGAPDAPDGAAPEVRGAILTLAAARLGSPSPSPAAVSAAAATVNAWAGRGPERTLAPAGEGGGLHLVPNLTPEQILGLVARDAIAFFGTGAADRLKECAHERCGMLFEDRSNGMRRQWCSMRECGNRMKARRHSGRR